MRATDGKHFIDVASPSAGRVTTLQQDMTTTTTAGVAVEAVMPQRTLHAKVVGTGAVTATVIVEVSLDNSTWITAGTITLSGTTSASDGFVMNAPWKWIRARISAVTGTGATVNCYLGA